MFSSVTIFTFITTFNTTFILLNFNLGSFLINLEEGITYFKRVFIKNSGKKILPFLN